MHIDGSTKLVGVFGWPITHTASPAMHNAAFEALRMNWAYLAFPVDPQNLRSALHGARDLGLAGVNLTVPHKILGLDIVDEVDSQARRLGAVNTVCIEYNTLRGFNTDGYGFARAIKEEFNLSLRGKRVLVLGAGGAGRAMAIQCALDGAAKIFVANRTPSKIDPIAREVSATKTAFQALELKSAQIARIIGDVDLLVNATSVGLRTADESPSPVAAPLPHTTAASRPTRLTGAPSPRRLKPAATVSPKAPNGGPDAAPAEEESLGLDASLFSSRLFVYDAIYRPAETALLRIAAEGGAKVANGLSMLLHQGAKSFELWTKRKAPVAVMRRALHAAIYGEST